MLGISLSFSVMILPLPLPQEASSEAGLIQGLTLAQAAGSEAGFPGALTMDFRVCWGVTGASLAASLHTCFQDSRIS